MKTILMLLITGLLLAIAGYLIPSIVVEAIGLLFIGAGLQKYFAKPKGFWQ